MTDPQSTHTAGPWHIADSSEIHDEGGQPICTVANEENSNLNAWTANANARLLVAAPDLLVELQNTNALVLELMTRAASIDRKLLELTKSIQRHELGEIVRLRQQIAKNQAVIYKIINL